MKNRIRTLVIVLVLVLVLSGVLIYLLNEKGAPAASETDRIATLWNKPESKVKCIETYCANYSWKAYYDEAGNLVFEGLESYPLNHEQVNNLIETSRTLRSQRSLKNADTNLVVYGLDETNCLNVKIEYEDLEVVEFSIGSNTQGLSSESVYVLYQDEIYVVYRNQVTPFMQKKENYINNMITPANKNAQYIPVYISIEDKEKEKPLTINYKSAQPTGTGQYMSSYKMISPREMDITYNESGSKLLQSIFGMTGEIIKVNITNNDLSFYGLDEARMTIQAVFVDAAGKNYSLQLFISEPDDEEMSYVALGGRDIIYRVHVTEHPWYTTDWQDVVGKQIIMPAIKDISEIQIKLEDVSHTFHLQYVGDDLHVDMNSAEKSPEEFKKLYQVLILPEVDVIADKKPEDDGKTLLEITYVYNNGHRDTVSFREGAIRQCYVYKNNEIFGIIRRTTVDSVCNNINRYLNDESISVILS